MHIIYDFYTAELIVRGGAESLGKSLWPSQDAPIANLSPRTASHYDSPLLDWFLLIKLSI